MSTSTNHSLFQVGGHPGILTTESGSLLIKPALQNEVAFYQRLQQDSDLEDLRAFTPTFLGMLKLMGKVDEMAIWSESVIVESVAEEEKDKSLALQLPQFQQVSPDAVSFYLHSIVLENLSFPFLKPNILDVKLGTVFYDDTASPEKVTRMQRVARETTSFETGVRLTGFQVYDNITCQHVKTPKSYGKSIKAAQLCEGIAKFFPIGSSASDMSSSSSGLPRETLEPILRAICEEITEIREVFSRLEMRMVGASLLIIYEADWTRAEQSLTLFSEENDEEDEDEDEDVDDDSDNEDESTLKRPGPPFVVKLIDFAHTRIAPGEGPDNGVLLGMETILRLLDARLTEICAS